MFLISPSQCRAARALLNWSQPDLAERSGMHVQTISMFENETSTPTKRTLERIVFTFEAAGVEFMPQEGVRRKIQDVKTYIGRDGFTDFMWDVCDTVEKSGGEICVSSVKEEWFTSPLTHEVNTAYRKKMAEIKRRKKFKFKILVQEGDFDFVASDYAEYRWTEERHFQAVPFYVYGNKLAIIHFQKGPTVHVVENQDIADAQRIQFNVFWENAKIPPKS